MVAKESLGLGQTGGTKKAFSRAVDLLTEHGEHEWERQGRTLARITFETLFEDTTKQGTTP